MLHINNVIQPCLLCGQHVTTPGAFFCNHCSIFQNKELLEKALTVEKPKEDLTVIHNEEWDSIIIDLNEEDDVQISFDRPEE